MRTISLRGLSRDAPSLAEPVIVTHEGRIIGHFIPGTELGFAPRVEAPITDDRFNTRPFTPAPKPTAKRK